MRAEHVLETSLYVDDLEKAEQFYAEVLGLKFVSRQPGRHAFFRCGDRMVLLFDPNASQQGDHFPPHGAIGAGHLAFGVTEISLVDWREWLEQRNVAIEKVIDWPGGGRSLYFRDPAGNSLELATPRIWGISEETLITHDQQSSGPETGY